MTQIHHIAYIFGLQILVNIRPETFLRRLARFFCVIHKSCKGCVSRCVSSSNHGKHNIVRKFPPIVLVYLCLQHHVDEACWPAVFTTPFVNDRVLVRNQLIVKFVYLSEILLA